MSLQDQLTAAQAEATQKHADADTADKVVTDIQAQIDAVQPHLGILAEMEDAAKKYGGEVESEFQALVDKFRAVLLSL